MATQTKQPSEYERSMAAAYKALSDLGGKLVQEEDIEVGDKFQIPKQMSLKQARDFLTIKMEEAQETVTLDRTFPYRFDDGAVALTRALHRFFGTFSHKGTMGFWGPNPPAFKEVEIGFGEKIQIPVGVVACPAIPDTQLHLGEGKHPELGRVFRIIAETKRAHRPAVEALLGLIEQELRENSIYKGKAIDAEFNFLDLSKVERDKVVYAADTYAQMEASVLAAIRYPHALREAGVELKSSVMLSGTYGVGKTLFAYLTGQECEANKVTFIQVRPNRDSIEDAIQTAAMYAPSVVFFEDLDTIADPQHETDHISGLLELFDGVRSKGREVMVILTTNHPERIHKGMLRPGRLDAVIEVTAPDRAGIVRLCKTLLPADLIVPDGITEAEWERVADAMEGYLPAFVHEACKRAIKYALVRAKGDLGSVRISGEDVRLAGVGLRAQFDQMMGAKQAPERESLGDALVATLRPALDEAADEAARRQVLATTHPRAVHPDNVEEAQAVHEAVEKDRR